MTDWGGMQDVAAQSTSAGVVLLVLTVAQVIFAELVPKSLALQYPTQTALYTLVPMVPSLWVYRPFIKWLNGTGVLLLRLLGSPSQTHRHIHSPDEIELLIAESRDGGLLEPDEHRRLQRALRLNLATGEAAHGAAHAASPRSTSIPRSNEVTGCCRAEPVSRGCPSIATPSTTSSGMLHTKDLVRWRVSGAHDVTLAAPVADRSRACTRA